MNLTKFLLVPLFITSTFSVPKTEQKTFDVTSGIVGNLEETAEVFEIPMHLSRTKSMLSFTAIGQIIDTKNNLLDSATVMKVNPKKETDFVLEIPLKQRLTKEGLKLVFTFNNSSSEMYIVSTFIYPIDKGEYDISKDKTLEFKPTAFSLEKDFVIKEYNESFDFAEFKNYFDSDTYYRLLFDSFIFKHDFIEEDLFYKSATLNVYHPIKEFFPFDRDEDLNVSIPLELKKVNGFVSIGYKDSFYVNPEDLTTSLKAQIGYSKTSYIYLPINKEKEIKETKFELVFEEIGINKTTLKSELTYGEVRRYIGGCTSSEYCVVGGIIR